MGRGKVKWRERGVGRGGKGRKEEVGKGRERIVGRENK